MLRFTLDANVFHELLGPHRLYHLYAVRLFELARQGHVQLFATTRIQVDIPGEPLRSQVAGLPVTSIGTVFRLDTSRMDSGDYLISKTEDVLERRLLELLFPSSDPSVPKHKNRLADVDHLIGHLNSGNDHFITLEKGILERSDQLLAIGIDVLQLAEAVEMLEGRSPSP